MADTIQETNVFPVNENGAVLLQSDTAGSNTVAGYLGSSKIPTDTSSNKMVVKLPVETGLLTSTPTGTLKISRSDNTQSLILPTALGRKGKVLFDGSDIANWATISGNTALSADTVNKKLSSSGLKIDFNSSASTDGVKKASTPTFAIQSGTVIKINLYISTANFVAGSVAVKFSSDNNSTKSLLFNIVGSYFRPGWNTLTFKAGEDGTTEFASGATWTAVGGQAWGDNFNYFHLNFTGFANKQITIDSVVIGNKDVPRVAFTFDDIDASTMNVIAPSLAANGWGACIMTDGDISKLNTVAANARILVNTYGWDYGTQGLTHTNYTSNGRDIAADFIQASANMVAYGFAAPTLFAYPVNASSVALDTTLAGLGVQWRRGAGFDIVTNSGIGIPQSEDGMIRSGFTQHLGTNYNLGTAFQQVKNRIDFLCQVGGVLSLFTHKETSLSTDWTLGGDLTQWFMLIDYLKLMQAQYGLQVILPSQIKSAITNSVFI